MVTKGLDALFWWRKVTFTCADVYACLEGDYSSWACEWKVAYDGSEDIANLLLRADETLDKIFIVNTYLKTFTIRALSDGTLDSVTAITLVGSGIYHKLYSIRRKYFAIILNVGGDPHLKIYKDGALQHTFDLSASPISWTNVSGDTYVISVSHDGKYILIDNIVTNEYALFKGS